VAGCATGGDDQNYRVLEEDRPILEGETGEPHGSAAPVEGATHFVMYQQDPALAQALEQPALRHDRLEVPVPESDPSGVIDRSNWTPMLVGPADGRTRHFPIYFEDPKREELYTDVLAQPTAQRQMTAALQSGDPTLTGGNLLSIVLEPADFALDAVLLPVRAVITPPWRRVTTPVREPVVTRGVVVLMPAEDGDAGIMEESNGGDDGAGEVEPPDSAGADTM
jgi:hypothetical protein